MIPYPNDFVVDLTVIRKIFDRSMPEEAPPPGGPIEQAPNYMAGIFPGDPYPENLFWLLKDGRAPITAQPWCTFSYKYRDSAILKARLQPTFEQIKEEIQEILLPTSEKSTTLKTLRNPSVEKGQPQVDCHDWSSCWSNSCCGDPADTAIGIISSQVSPYGALKKELVAEMTMSWAPANDMTGSHIQPENWKGGVQ